jgi:hypothetical protein
MHDYFIQFPFPALLLEPPFSSILQGTHPIRQPSNHHRNRSERQTPNQSRLNPSSPLESSRRRSTTRSLTQHPLLNRSILFLLWPRPCPVSQTLRFTSELSVLSIEGTCAPTSLPPFHPPFSRLLFKSNFTRLSSGIVKQNRDTIELLS